jgi:hypothetical protein
MIINTGMKIAILISGEPRFTNYINDFINSLQGVDQADWFFYLWKETPHNEKFERIPKGWHNIPSQEWAINNIQHRLPNNHNVASLKLGEQYESPKTDVIHKQFWGIYQSDLLRQEYEKINGPYDLVIRARLDLLINDPIDLQNLRNQLDHNLKLMFLPKSPRYGYHQEKINDQFAISSPENIKIYADLVNHISHRVQHENVTLHQETQLVYHLLKNELELHHELNIKNLNQLPENLSNWVIS